MSESDIRVELTLELAHGASEPSAADAARNLSALRARLGLPAAPASAGGAASAPAAAPGASGAAASHVAMGSHVATASSTLGTAVAPAGAVSSIAASATGAGTAPAAAALGTSGSGLGRLLTASALTGVAGFLLGLFVAAPALLDRSSPAPVVPPTASVAADDGRPEARASAAMSTEVSSDLLAEGDVTPAEAEATAPEGPASATLADRRAARGADPANAEARARASRAHGAAPRTRAHARSHATSPATAEPDFLDAVRWLRRAQRAVRRGEPALALGLLDELDARFPREMLGEERQATRALGLCGVEQVDAARALAGDLIAHSPRSIYAERLRASCAAPALDGSRER